MPKFVRVDYVSKTGQTASTAYYNLVNLQYATFATDPLRDERTGSLYFAGRPEITVLGKQATDVESQLAVLLAD